MNLSESSINQLRNSLSIGLFLGGISIPLLASWKYGSALFPDSVNYLHAARSLVESGEWKQFTGEYFVSWPPLFALLIALFSGFGWIPYTIAAQFINLISGAFTVLFVFRLMSKEVHTTIELYLCFFLGLSMWPVLNLSSEIISEPLFIALTIGGFYAVADRKWFIWGIIGFSLAMLQRYIGFIWWFYIVIWGFIEFRKKHLWSLICALSIFPLGFWLIRNLSHTQTLTGVRDGDFVPFNETLLRGFDILSKWIMPHFIPTWLRISILLLVFLFIWGYLITHYKNRVGVHAFVMGLIYLFSIGMSSSFGASEPMSFRLLAPLYPFFLVSLWRSMHRFFTFIVPQLQTFFRFALIAIASFQLIFLFRLTADKFERGSGGFAREYWMQSEGMISAKQLSKDFPTLVSNAADGIYARTQIYASMSPFHYQKDRLEEIIPKQTALIWFNEINRKTLIPLDTLVRELHLKHLYTYSDSEVWVRE
jgi:hypothetical protein